MIPAPRPADEPDRLSALRELLLLDTPPEQRFDRIVQFVADEFDMPIVLLSLVDANRQWFKARVGFDACESARDVSFCGHAIVGRDLFVIEDARVDERFADNPMVTGPASVRFYAGAPLHLSDTGSAVGTLCLIDTQPRRLDRLERAILGSLRDLAVDELLTQDRHA